MTRGLSVRARLTTLVVVVAAGLGLAAATIGVGAVERRLVDEAIDVAVADQLLTVEELILFREFGGIDEGGFDEGEFDEGLFDEGFVVLDELAFLQGMIFELGELEAFDELLAAVGIEAGGSLAVLTYFGEVIIVDTRTGEMGFVADEDSASTELIVAQSTIDELFNVSVDIDFGDIFSDEVFGDEEFGESEDHSLDLRFVTHTIDGQDYLFVAEVGDVTRSVDSIRTLAWISVPLLVVIGGLATWLLTGRALRPVHAITAQVGEISGGTLDERVPVPQTDDEIAELATTMNLMLDRLEVDDRRLRQFVSDASHELRSPVAVLRSESEVALRNPGSTSVEGLADGVLAESTRLQRIVEDLLVLARGDEGTVSGSEVIDLDDIVLVEAARRRAVPIDTQGVSAGRIRGSHDAAARIVTHLLDNAARHAASSVWIGLRTEHEHVALWVDDDGEGIAEADRKRVFERFTRFDAARTRDHGGAGLGLAVVSEVVAATGGTIEVVTAPSGGARFVVRWPELRD